MIHLVKNWEDNSIEQPGLCLDYNTEGYFCLFVQVGEMSGVVETDSGVHVIKRTA